MSTVHRGLIEEERADERANDGQEAQAVRSDRLADDNHANVNPNQGSARQGVRRSWTTGDRLLLGAMGAVILSVIVTGLLIAWYSA